jgi:hypothetical protein
MNTFLWILAGITAAAFLMAGAMKLITPREKLKEMMAWVGDVSTGLIKFMGVAEILGRWVSSFLRSWASPKSSLRSLPPA